MKRIALAMVGVVLAFPGLLVIPTLLYNLIGLFGIRDGADGPKWVLALVMLGCITVACAAFFFSFRLLRPAFLSRKGSS